MEYTEKEMEIARRYQRITGVGMNSMTGLIDTLRILTGEDMLPLLEEYLTTKKCRHELLITSWEETPRGGVICNECRVDALRLGLVAKGIAYDYDIDLNVWTRSK